MASELLLTSANISCNEISRSEIAMKFTIFYKIMAIALTILSAGCVIYNFAIGDATNATYFILCILITWAVGKFKMSSVRKLKPENLCFTISVSDIVSVENVKSDPKISTKSGKAYRFLIRKSDTWKSKINNLINNSTNEA